MTLERWTTTGTEHVRLVECPFCGESIGPTEGRKRTRYSGAAAHLRRCEVFYERMGVDPEAPLEGRRDGGRDEHDPVSPV